MQTRHDTRANPGTDRGHAGTWRRTLGALGLVLGLASIAVAGPFETRLNPPDAADGDLFGTSVAFEGDVAVVGAPGDDGEAGAAYVYIRCGGAWTLKAKLVPLDDAPAASFGSSVALSGDTAVVGATGDADGGQDAGAAYVFRRDAAGKWAEHAKLVASDAAAGDGFGSSVAVLGTTVTVGAALDDAAAGSAYVFMRDAGGTWGEHAKLVAADSAADDLFGSSVVCSGDTLFVGAPGDDGATGAAYVFERDGSGTWIERAKLLAPEPGMGDSFGFAVALSGDLALVAAPADEGGAPESGVTHLFSRDPSGTWSAQHAFEASDGATGDRFGSSVGLSGNKVVVGAPRDEGGMGAAYVFSRTAAGTWVEQIKLRAAAPTAGDHFGMSVAVEGDTALLGASGDVEGGVAGGSVLAQRLLVSKLTASDAKQYAEFGCVVAISGHTAVVGARIDGDPYLYSPFPGQPGYYQYPQFGAAYVFVRDTSGTWSEQQKLTASDAAEYDEFGTTVALSDDVVLVGAPKDDHSGRSDAGSVYVFTRDASGTWSEQQKLTASRLVSNGRFGSHIAVSGDTAVIAHADSVSSGYSSKQTYVFTRDAAGTWSESQTLTNVGSQFRGPVAISGDLLVANEWRSSESGAVFERDAAGTWTWRDRVVSGRTYSVPGDGTVLVGTSGYVYRYMENSSGTLQTKERWYGRDNGFGEALAASGDTLVAGVYSGASYNGSVYVLRGLRPSAPNAAYVSGNVPEPPWLELTAPDGQRSDYLGESVDASGDTIVAGAKHDRNAGTRTGSAYVFSDLDRVVEPEPEQDLAIPDAPLPASPAGGSYSAVVRTVGGARPLRFEVSSGALPPGLELDFRTGAVTGTCGHEGTYVFLVRVSDPCGHAATQPYTITVHGGPRITTTALATATAGRPCRRQFEAAGGTAPLTWSLESGGLPVAGPLDPATGAFEGDALASGPYPFTVRVTDANGLSDERSLLVPVEPVPRITTTSVAQGTTGRPYSQELSMSGGLEPVTWSLASGELPVTGPLDTATGRVAGEAAAPGMYDFTLRVTDSNGATAERSFSTTIHELPEIVTAELPVAVLDRPFAATVAGTGGMSPFTWSVVFGAPPPGLQIDFDGAPDDGSPPGLDGTPLTLSGTPTERGRSEFTLRCVDAAGAVVERIFRVDVAPVADLSRGKLTTSLPINVLNGTTPVVRALELVVGTQLDVALRFSGAGAPPVQLDVVDAAGHSITDTATHKTTARCIRISRIVVPATGRYLVRVLPLEPFAAMLRLSVKATAPKVVRGTATLAPGETVDVHVGALAGARVSVMVKRARGSTAAPRIGSVRDSDGNELLRRGELRTGPTRDALRMKTPVAPGRLTIRLGTADGGEITWRIAVKQPRGYAHTEPDLVSGSSK